MEIFLSYGEWIKLQKHVDLYVGICRVFFFFFFFDEYVWAGKFLNSRQKDFETLSWPDETSVIQCAVSCDRGPATCRSRNGRRDGCHNDRPAIGSRSVFENYEASFNAFRSVFPGF
jgi:hypothetical protein